MRAALVLLALVLVPRAASAIPAFARKYAAPCGLCHAPAYPALNPVGRRFKERGYQLPPEAEATYRAASAVRPDPEQPLELLQQLPLALRAQGTVAFAPDPERAGENAVDLRPFQALYLLAGASVYPGVSFFAATTLAPEAGLHHASISFHDLLFGEDRLNLRFGRLLLLDFDRPEHRTLTVHGHPTTTTPVGLVPTVLDSTQHGLDLYGRFWAGRLFYRAAVVQGAQGPDGVRDLDGFKDLFGELQLTPHHLVTVGALAYRGRPQITDETRGVAVRFTDAFWIAGGTAELRLPWVDLYGEALYTSHDNPAGDGEHVDHWAWRAEVRAWLGPRWYLVARYDQLTSHHLTDVHHATVHLGGLLLGNLRLGAESSVPLDAVERAAAYLVVDLAF